MTTSSIFSDHAVRLRQFMAQSLAFPAPPAAVLDETFNPLALETFALQFQYNAAYQRWCRSLGVSPETIARWSDIPALPTSAFKELEVTSLAPMDRTLVFHSSGTTERRPSRHFHKVESLSLYEASLLGWFRPCLMREGRGKIRFLALTPPPTSAPHSSLVHMFETLQREAGVGAARFFGAIDETGAWSLDERGVEAAVREADAAGEPVMLLGTAFSYVNWLDRLVADGRTLRLPPGSRVLETGGYKGRSRTLPKAELHQLLAERLGITREQIICEYGMSELSSQAYDVASTTGSVAGSSARHFHFPPWARVRILSPETGREVPDGETGLVRVLDLVNLWSVAAVQTEDLAIRRGSGFELVGRAVTAEARGCSLMSVTR